MENIAETSEVGQFHYELLNVIKTHRPELLLLNTTALNEFITSRVAKASTHFEALRRENVDVNSTHESALEVLYGDLLEESPCEIIKNWLKEFHEDFADELIERNQLDHFVVHFWMSVKDEYPTADEFRANEEKILEEIQAFIESYGI